MRSPRALFILAAAAVLLGAGSAFAFTSPAGAPPTCPAGYAGCDVPLNQGATTQSKNSFDVSGLTNGLGVASISTNWLSVRGAGGSITLNNAAPFPVGFSSTNALYNNGGSLYFNGSPVSSGGNTTSNGTAGYLPKFTAPTTLGNSIVSDNGATLTVAGALSVTGAVNTGGNISVGSATLFTNGDTFMPWANTTYGAGRAYASQVFCRFDGTNCLAGAAPAWASITGKPFNFNGQAGQPTWLWGTNDGSSYYVWNPSNFRVDSASHLYTANGNYTTWHANGIAQPTYVWGTNDANEQYLTQPSLFSVADSAALGGIAASSYRRLDVWQSNHLSASDGSEYAQVFRDSANGGLYVDPAGGSVGDYGLYTDGPLNVPVSAVMAAYWGANIVSGGIYGTAVTNSQGTYAYLSYSNYGLYTNGVVDAAAANVAGSPVCTANGANCPVGDDLAHSNFGGMWETVGPACQQGNYYTGGGCSCPAGFAPSLAGWTAGQATYTFYYCLK
jgi:hypothetical protein